VTQPLGHQKAIGSDAQGKLLLEILTVTLNGPTHLADRHQTFERGVGGQRGQNVFLWFALPFGPFDQKPFFIPPLGPAVIPMRGVHAARRRLDRRLRQPETEKHLGHSEEWPKCLFLLVGAAGFELATPCTP